jgi:hypothetical protein
VRLRLTLLAAAVALVLPTLSPAAFESIDAVREETREVAIFYYGWFGTPDRDGEWRHWNQRGAQPPYDVAASFYPARGPYSSADAAVLAAHMREIASAGVDTVVASWWGGTDRAIREVAAAAAKRGLRVAVHLEPYGGRTVETVAADLAQLRALGIRDVYVYDSVAIPDDEWARLNAGVSDMRVFANTPLAGRAKAGGFAGLYTYDVLLYDGRLFPRMCEQAQRLGLLCAPSVGPGYDARNATPDERVRDRRDGARYDAMWHGALSAGADIVTITSYNEWHEGTQIEPARAAGGGGRYACYDGAWGLTGRQAETAYLDRTAFWAAQYHRGGQPLLSR